MPVPTTITDLSTTAASNYPQGTDSPATLDDTQRAHGAFIRQIQTGAVATTANVTAGTINGATVGATTPASGAFTTLSATGNATFNTAAASVGVSSIDGTATGSGGGALFAVKNGGSNNIILGNKSAILGGAYDSTATIYSTGPIDIYGAATKVGTLSSTGLSVTGTLSSTGAITTDSGFVTGTGTAGGSGMVVTATNNKAFVGGSAIGDFSSTGLAVTGALSSTGTITSGDGTSSAAYITATGPASGTNGGSSIYTKNGGAIITGIGNYSNINGGAYDNTGTLYSANSWRFVVNGSVSAAIAATLDTSGNLGLGVTPSSKLHVYDTSARFVTLGNASSTWTFGPSGSSFAWKENSAGADQMTLDASGNLIQTVNSTAPTLSTNKTLAFELTSDTSLKIKVRGSDGITRSVTLTLA